jgi:hypothetical protein
MDYQHPTSVGVHPMYRIAAFCLHLMVVAGTVVVVTALCIMLIHADVELSHKAASYTYFHLASKYGSTFCRLHHPP